MRKKHLLLWSSLLVGVLSVSGMAGAHAQRALFLPGPGAVVSGSPTELNLTFTQPFTAIEIEVYDAKGQSVAAGKPVLDPAHPDQAILPLKAELPAGTYTVKWRAAGADGHGSEGQYLYHVTDVKPVEQPQLFWNGKLVEGDVPAQIVDGRLMVPVRALAESLGLVASFDAEQRFVTVSPAPASGHGHGTPYVAPAESPVPTLELTVHKDAKTGFVVQAQTTNWTWAPLHANSAAVPNEGHAHLYLDGVKLNRLYGEWYQIDGVDNGYHEITVTLNANDHSEYAVAGAEGPVLVTKTVAVLGGKMVGAVAPAGHEHAEAPAADHDHDEAAGHDHDH